MSNLVWSYSMLDCFETCPNKWHDKYILKNKEPETEQTRYGNFIHSSLENYLLGQGDLPEELEGNRALVDSIASRFRGDCKAELKMGLSVSLGPEQFFGGGVWGRGAADVVLMNDSDHAFIGDWKTGKRREKEDQLKILSMFLFKHYPHINVVSAANIWLKESKLGQVYRFYRAAEKEMWVGLIKRLQPMYAAVGTEKATETKPGFLCKSYCPVKTCKFNGR